VQNVTDILVISMLAGINVLFLMILIKLDVLGSASIRRNAALSAEHGKTREVLDAVVNHLLEQERKEGARQKAAHDAIYQRIASMGA
jgi:hypothetical protein